MRYGPFSSIGALALGVAGVSLAVVHVVGQVPSAKTTRTAVAKPSPLRTPWGDPDLQGVWNYANATSPLERPSVRNPAHCDRAFQSNVIANSNPS